MERRIVGGATLVVVALLGMLAVRAMVADCPFAGTVKAAELSREELIAENQRLYKENAELRERYNRLQKEYGHLKLEYDALKTKVEKGGLGSDSGPAKPKAPPKGC